MNRIFFRKICFLFCTLLLTFGFNANAQDGDNNHFIYIQAKSKQPFYVILNKKVYSSSTIGYLIIPKLKNGTYDLKIGFPKQYASEQDFTCIVRDADVGYSLQNNNNGDLGLLDLQSQAFISAAKGANDDATVATVTKVTPQAAEAVDNTAKAAVEQSSSAFGDMLSSAANDSTLKQQPVVQPKAEMPLQATIQQPALAPEQTDSFGANPQMDTKAVIAASGEKLKAGEVGNDMETYGVIKSSESNMSAGQQMTFVLFNSRSSDTVQILVPQNTPAKSEDAGTGQPVMPSATGNKQSGDRSLALFENTNGDTVPADADAVSDVSKVSKKKKSKKASDVQTLDVQTGNADTAGSVNNPFYNGSNTASGNNNNMKQDENSSVAQSSIPPCDNPVTDKDLDKMQKKMISKGNDDDMLSIADKSTKGKCITTQQVKQLGGLFLSDAGRFALYQDVYSSVSDKDNYSSLQSQLLDTYFKTRFLNMLKNQ